MPALPKERWPKPLRNHPEVKGVFVGDCLVPKDKRPRQDRKTGFNSDTVNAHAHYKNGWICVQYPHDLGNDIVMLHELAHLKDPTPVAYNGGHGVGWKNTLLELAMAFDGRLVAEAKKEIERYDLPPRPSWWQRPPKNKAEKRLKAMDRIIAELGYYGADYQKAKASGRWSKPGSGPGSLEYYLSSYTAQIHEYIHARVRDHAFALADLKARAKETGSELDLTGWPRE